VAAAATPAQRFRSRPMSQGSNAWADHGCLSALQLLSSALLPAFNSAADTEARDKMMLASTMAGIAFGNVGVRQSQTLHSLSTAAAALSANQTAHLNLFCFLCAPLFCQTFLTRCRML
jgi:alcohol dehydrogenase class IV